jgi:ADP-heptose:LPS heptosyltransferase
MRILISRTDSIGDVILTLPLCGWLKQHEPAHEIYFLCQNLTASIVRKSAFVDQVIIWDGELPEVDAIIHVFPSIEIAQLARKKSIPIRIGTSHRWYHWLTCNKLEHFSRINSELHESQLNFKLVKKIYPLADIPDLATMPKYIGWDVHEDGNGFIDKDRFNLVMHIKSRGSAKEWDASNYLKLARTLGDRFNIVLTGTDTEKAIIQEEIPDIFDLKNVTDTTGKLSLDQLCGLIQASDGLLACSTGPLHIAAVSGIHTLGLFPLKKPMHAGRWKPIGEQVEIMSETEESQDKLLKISIHKVSKTIQSWLA